MAATPTPPPTEVQPGLWLDSRRAVYFSRLRLLVVADLHWGYAESHRLQGNLVPIWGDTDIATRLRGLVMTFAPERMLWLGDSLHTVAGRSAAEHFLAMSPIPVLIIPGNHDRTWRPAGAAAGRVTVVETWREDALYFHHGDRSADIPADCTEVLGHFHPAVSWQDGAGTRLKLPALIAGPRRIILPAFSPWAGGVPWQDQLDEKETLWAIAPKRVFAVPKLSRLSTLPGSSCASPSASSSS